MSCDLVAWIMDNVHKLCLNKYPLVTEGISVTVSVILTGAREGTGTDCSPES